MAARIRADGGFTLVESVVAALLVSLVSLAVMTAFDSSRRATFRAEQSQVASDLAQRELERIRANDYGEIGLTAAPGTSADPDDPRSRVSGSTFALKRDGSEAMELVVEGGSLVDGGTVSGSAVDPGPEAFSSGDISGHIHRFVVWRDDPRCEELLICPGAQDLKRIIIAVTLDTTATGGSRNYAEVQSDVIDPDDSILTDADPPELGELVVAQQFWLSDERCTASGEPAHSLTLSSHPARDTRGINCESGTADRPDALVTTPPSNLDQTLDFADDLEPPEPIPPDADAGLQFEIPSSDGCQITWGGPNGHYRSHVWVSRALSQEFVMSGGGTLELWIRSINDIVTSGRICVVLFTRLEDPLGLLPPTDLPLADLDNPPNLHFTYDVADWPRGDWGRVRIPMSFAGLTVGAGERLGIAVGLERAGTPSDQVMLQYDHQVLKSRLEIETTTPLP